MIKVIKNFFKSRRSNTVGIVCMVCFVFFTVFGCEKHIVNNNDDDNSIQQEQIVITTIPKGSVDFEMDGTGTATIYYGDRNESTTHTFENLDPNIKYGYLFLPVTDSACKIIITGNITSFICKGYIASIDVSKNNALTKLCCNGLLTNLDISKNTALTYLDCTRYDIRKYNELKLTSLDLSNNTALTYLKCHYHNLTTTALNDLFESLHSNIISGGKEMHISLSYETKDCNISIAESKGWNVNVSYY